MWCDVGHSFVVWCWDGCIVCCGVVGGVSFRLTGVARVPRAGSVVGSLAGACLVGAFCVGGSLGVARG